MLVTTVLPQTGYLRLRSVLNFFPVGKSTWWAGVKSGRFPQAVKRGPRITAWRAEDIRALIDAVKGGTQPESRDRGAKS
jgi:predicted DNA-binding transcriptional regulator AlpA